MKIRKKVILFFSNYLPLQIWTLKICNNDISKTIAARSFRLGQLIEDDEYRRSIGENLKKSFFIFFKLFPFADLDFEIFLS